MVHLKVNNLTGDDLERHLKRVLEITDQLQTVNTNEPVEIDLSSAKWFNPSFLAPLSVLYHQLRDSSHDVYFELPQNYQTQSYFGQIGFPDGDVDPSFSYENHLPLYHIDPSDGPNAISDVSTKIRNLIIRHLSDDVGHLNATQYPISETISNVEIHSDCTHGSLLVQYYPTKECLDICIVDDGISIPGNFEAHGFDFDSDYDALELAMTERITTREDEERQQGYGLYTIEKMVCEGLNGRVILASRNGILSREGDRRYEILGDYGWNGTIFAARLDTPGEDFDFLNYLT